MHRKLKKNKRFFYSVCACTHTCVCVRMHVKWMSTEDPLGSGVAGDVGAGNLIQVLCKNRKHLTGEPSLQPPHKKVSFILETAFSLQICM